MLSKKSYREVVKGLEDFYRQHLEDRRENPGAIPPAWGIPLRMMIENIIRGNHERFHKNLANETLEYLVSKGLLVRYVGDYTFPTDEELPSAEVIKLHAALIARRLDKRINS
jgi:hypothetical protein